MTSNKVRKLLDLAEGAIKRVLNDVSYKRPDRAYVEYLVGSEILLNIIPKHQKKYTSVDSDKDKAEFQRRFTPLREVSTLFTLAGCSKKTIVTKANIIYISKSMLNTL